MPKDRSEYFREYARKNKEKRKAIKKRWQEKNREKHAEYQRQWRAAKKGEPLPEKHVKVKPVPRIPIPIADNEDDNLSERFKAWREGRK